MSVLVGLALLVADRSIWLYAGVVSAGGILALAAGWRRARRLQPAMDKVQKETGYIPWVETIWPSWARKVFFAWVGLMVFLWATILILGLVVAFTDG